VVSVEPSVFAVGGVQVAVNCEPQVGVLAAVLGGGLSPSKREHEAKPNSAKQNANFKDCIWMSLAVREHSSALSGRQFEPEKMPA
jgi:hypothetical protein